MNKTDENKEQVIPELNSKPQTTETKSHMEFIKDGLVGFTPLPEVLVKIVVQCIHTETMPKWREGSVLDITYAAQRQEYIIAAGGRVIVFDKHWNILKTITFSANKMVVAVSYIEADRVAILLLHYPSISFTVLVANIDRVRSSENELLICSRFNMSPAPSSISAIPVKADTCHIIMNTSRGVYILKDINYTSPGSNTEKNPIFFPIPQPNEITQDLPLTCVVSDPIDILPNTQVIVPPGGDFFRGFSVHEFGSDGNSAPDFIMKDTAQAIIRGGKIHGEIIVAKKTDGLLSAKYPNRAFKELNYTHTPNSNNIASVTDFQFLNITTLLIFNSNGDIVMYDLTGMTSILVGGHTFDSNCYKRASDCVVKSIVMDNNMVLCLTRKGVVFVLHY